MPARILHGDPEEEKRLYLRAFWNAAAEEARKNWLRNRIEVECRNVALTSEILAELESLWDGRTRMLAEIQQLKTSVELLRHANDS